MERVRCVIADMSQKMLADIVQNTVEQMSFIEVVDRVHGIKDIASLVARKRADVLILGIDSGEFAKVCTDVMNHIADILIIGLIDDGRRLAVVYDNVDRNDIVNIIHVLRYSAAGRA